MELTRDELYVLGTDAFERGDYERAERLLGQFLAAGVPFADVLNRLGLAAHHRGDFKTALDRFGEALALNPGYNEAALNLAVTLMDLGRYEEAARVYGHARPGGPVAAQPRGPHEDHPEEPAASPSLSAGRPPLPPQAASCLGTPAEGGHPGPRSGLRGVWDPVSALDPFVRGKLANRQADLGSTYHALGLFEHAIEAFEAALRLCPTFPDIRLKLGVALRDAGRLDESAEQFEALKADAPHYAMAGVQLGITRYVASDPGGAVAEWLTVLADHPGHPRAEMYLRLVQRRRRAAS